MPKFKNVSPFGVIDVPVAGGLIEAGAEFEVSDEIALSLAGQVEHFAPVDEAAEAAVTTAAEHLAAVNVVLSDNPLALIEPGQDVLALAAEVATRSAEPPTDEPPTDEGVKSKGKPKAGKAEDQTNQEEVDA